MVVFFIFIKHRVLILLRGSGSSKDVIYGALELFTKIYIGLYLVKIAFNIKFFFENIFPQKDALDVIQDNFYIYIFIDFILRWVLQSKSGFDIYPYLILPVKRKRFVRFLYLEELLSFFNFFSLLFFTFASFNFVVPGYGLIAGMAWIVAATSIVLINDHVIRYIKGSLSYHFLRIIPILIGFFAIYKLTVGLELFHFVYLEKFIHTPLLCIFPMIVAMVIGNRYMSYMQGKLYDEEVYNLSSKAVDYKDTGRILSFFGLAGELVRLELRLIVRNRRPREFLLASIFILLYFEYLFFEISVNQSNPILLFGMATVGIGLGMMNYGQLMYGWDGSYFDFILVQKIPLKEYLKAKRILLTIFCLMGFLTFLPLLYFIPGIMKYLLLALLTNTGIVMPILILWANYNRRAIRLEKGTMFNYEGINGAQFFGMGLMFLLIALILAPFLLVDQMEVGFFVLGFLGVLSISSGNYWDTIFEDLFIKYKYSIADDFIK